MSTRRKNPQTLVLDPGPLTDEEAADTLEYPAEEALTTEPDDVAASLCPTCGELLAWHEMPCSATTPTLSASPNTAPNEAASSLPTPIASGFTYAIGQPVQPAPATQAGRVIWRGQVKERHPRTGLLHRVNVYRLDNGYWDCYYEAELQAA